MRRTRIDEISDEMSGLLDEQSRLLKEISLTKFSREDLDAYAERNKRLRDLCRQLNTE
jgi:hypothetical protein